jgi:hypothetical protein
MIWLVVLALIVLLVLAVWVIRGDSPSEEEIDPEEATRAAIELHAIRRRIDVARTRSQLQRDAMQVRREIAEELREAP